MKSSVADVRNLVEVVWYDDADAEISTTSAYDDSTTNPTSWTVKSYVATPVSTAVRAKLRLTGCHSSDATTGSTWFDGILAYEGVNIATDNTLTGDNTLSGTTTQSGLLSLTSGQLKFPATQIPSTNVNTLDDYEEGTWTPTVGATTETSVSGYYVKIGKLVWIKGAIGITTLGGGSTSTITGLPFTVAPEGDTSGSVSSFSNLALSVYWISCAPSAGGTSLTFPILTAAAASSTPTGAIFGNSATIAFTATYRTTA